MRLLLSSPWCGPSLLHAQDSIHAKVGLKALARFVPHTLGAELCRQQVVLPPDPTRDQEGIDQGPYDGDDHPDDGEAQDQLRYRNASASQIEIMGTEQPQE